MKNHVIVQAPSNIAILKYMGKKKENSNTPFNSSISLTLNDLKTVIEVEINQNKSPLEFEYVLQSSPEKQSSPLSLTEVGLAKVNNHIHRIITEELEVFESVGLSFSTEGSYFLRSYNTFPMGAGIASSASSFAALTLAVLFSTCKEKERFSSLFSSNLEFKKNIAQISQKGSGSSCRSFFPGFVRWSESELESLPSSLPNLCDLVLVVDEKEKKISSSQAHRLVASSMMYPERPNRTEKRSQWIIEKLKEGNFLDLSEIIFNEALEMHSLFHTAEQPFSYWKPKTVEVIFWFNQEMTKADFKLKPAWLTLDAGANIHLIAFANDREAWLKNINLHFPEIRVLSDQQGGGASIVDF